MKKSYLVLLMFICLVVASTSAFAADFEFPNVDFGGRTINFVTSYGNFDENRLMDAEEKFNVKINHIHVDWGQTAEQYMSRLLAGESEWDIWFTSSNHFMTLAPERAFFPMSEVLPREYFLTLNPEAVGDVKTLEYLGTVYGFNSHGTKLNDMIFWVYNKTLFEREGLPDAHELYLAGEWTWDAATSIAIAATRDTNGDGEIDQLGIGDIHPTQFVVASGGRVVEKNEDGRMVFAFNQEPAVAAMNQLYEWQSVHQVMGGTWDQREFVEGKRAMTNVWGWQLWSLPNMEEQFGILPYPRSPFQDEYSTQSDLMRAFFLPANSANPLAKAALVDFLVPTVEEYYEQVLEPLIFSWAPDRISAEILLSSIEDWSVQFNVLTRIDPGHNRLGAAVREVRSGAKTTTQVMNEIEAFMQAWINDIYQQ